MVAPLMLPIIIIIYIIIIIIIIIIMVITYSPESKFLSVHYIHAKLPTMMPWVGGYTSAIYYTVVLSSHVCF